MAAADAARTSRQAAIVSAVAGIHIGAFILATGGLLPRLLATAAAQPLVSIIERPPEPVESTRPETVKPGEYLAEREPAPELVIPRIEQEAATADSTLIRSLDVTGGGTGAQQVSEAPELRLRDNRLVALIGACYPAASRRAGEEGRAVVRIVIDAAGRAGSWSLAQGTGFPRLDAAVGCVIPRLEFHPARLDGRAVAAEARLPIAFQLD